MVSASDFRNGVTLEIDGQVVQVIEFQHVKPGKGAAFVRTKLKNVINGGVTERTFRPTEKFPPAHIDRVDMQYLYDDGEMYNFMNPETFEQIALSHDQIADAMKFVKENETCRVDSYQGKVFSVEPPLKVTLEVTHTEPGVKGNTATGATKPATLETGAEIQVPLFINTGDKVIVSTQTGSYESRG
jgi:elongation factor P